MDFDGITYPWLHLWMLSAVPLGAFCLGALACKVLGRWTWGVIVIGIGIVVIMKVAGG